MITVERLLFLQNVALFGKMKTRELGHIAAIAEEVVFTAGEPIFAKGDYGDSMYLIVEGQVRIHRGGVRLNVLDEKAYFGEMALLDGEPRSASATAQTDCLLLRIGQEEFLHFLSGNFAAALTILRTITQRLRDVMEAHDRQVIEADKRSQEAEASNARTAS